MSYPKNIRNKAIIQINNGEDVWSLLYEKYKDDALKVKETARTNLFINEVFPAIQGEGYSMWCPVVFVRTYGCNLRCGFKNPDGTKGCDTPYTWKPSETMIDDKNMYTPEMLVDEIMMYPSHKHWVISWWEPLLQQDKLIEVIKVYRERNGFYPYVEVETNGTVIPSKEFAQLVNHFNVSVKLENSNATEETWYSKEDYEYWFNTEERRIKEAAILDFSSRSNAYFKFVVDRELKVLKEIEGIKERFGIDNWNIMLMPEWNSPEDMNASSENIINYCIEKGYRFSTRLHILVYWYRRWV